MTYQKFTINKEIIPQDLRKEINNKILYLIESGLQSNITAEDIFNSYTGNGGLHGLKADDYASYYEFSQAKQKIENGQFFTSPEICRFIVSCIRPGEHDLISDLTCGTGNFFNYIENEANCYGCEVDQKAVKVVKFLYPAVNISQDDIRYYNPEINFDIIFGNPPFNLRWETNEGEFLSQFYYFLKAYSLLKPAGFLAVIVPGSFLEDEFIDGGMMKQINEKFNFVCQLALPDNAFNKLGIKNFSTKLMIFQKKSQYLESIDYTTQKIICSDYSEKAAVQIFNEKIKPLVELKEKIRINLYFENVHSQDNKAFSYQVNKLLYDIKRNPKTNINYGKCLAYLFKFQNQKQPDNMKSEEWEKRKITPVKVISYLKNTLQKQNYKEIDKIKLVKTSYGLRLKAYSHKTKIALNKTAGIKEISFNDMILQGSYPFEDKTYQKLFNQKFIAWHKQNLKITDIKENKEIRGFLENYTLVEKQQDLFSTEKTIKFNAIQKADLEKILQKQYAPILSWQQGSGKTLAAISNIDFLSKYKSVNNYFVVGPALAINITWEEKLKAYNKKYLKIESLKDINKIQKDNIVLISFDMLIKYQRFIKKYVKKQCQKVALIVDECDELTNYKSLRTLATINCFRKVKYKLLQTGTTTRNNINELYPQLELLYNNSINFLCDCEYVYHLNKENELEEKYNSNYMLPFPAYKGYSIFKACYSPYKTTVFGIKKHNQDIYNQDSLTNLINKSILTRTFKEIVGSDKYKIITHRINQNTSEQELYKIIIDEFYRMVSYFRNTGNSRKESMLKIIRQIQLLIKSTSIPHKFNEYTSNSLPEKYYKILSLIEKWQDEKIAIGTVFLEAANDYFTHLKNHFSERPIFLIKGDIGFKERAKIIKAFEATNNGILISTQQSLKSSVNIPSCNKVIIESMQWNMPKIEQYFFRFVRFDSLENTEVHFITYNYSIEQNLLALLMAKEKINQFIKTQNVASQDELLNKFGIDQNIFECIMEKVKDKDGKVQIAWGQQKIS